MSITVLERKSSKDVADQWKAQYLKDNGKWSSTISGDAGDTYQRIVAAGDDPDKIDAASGNRSWTKHSCDSCFNPFDVGVNMLEPDRETTPTFCADCILKAAKMVRAMLRKMDQEKVQYHTK